MGAGGQLLLLLRSTEPRAKAGNQGGDLTRKALQQSLGKGGQERASIVQSLSLACFHSQLDEFKQTHGEYLSKVPDDPKCDGLSPGVSNVQSSRPTNTIIYQGVRRKKAWRDTRSWTQPPVSTLTC